MDVKYQIYIIYAISAILGITLTTLMLIWICKYLGGFSWRSNPELEANWHGLLMTIGLILYAQSILLYRICGCLRHKIIRICHAFILFVVFILYVIGLQAIFDSHNLEKPPIMNMYSLHSWMGLSTMIIFSLEYVFGFIVFMYPGFQSESLLTTHVHLGIIGFILGLIEATTGIYEKLFSTFPPGYYEKLKPDAVLVNCIGTVLVLFGISVIYLVNNKNFQLLRPDIESVET